MKATNKIINCWFSLVDLWCIQNYLGHVVPKKLYTLFERMQCACKWCCSCQWWQVEGAVTLFLPLETTWEITVFAKQLYRRWRFSSKSQVFLPMKQYSQLHWNSSWINFLEEMKNQRYADVLIKNRATEFLHYAYRYCAWLVQPLWLWCHFGSKHKQASHSTPEKIQGFGPVSIWFETFIV